MALLDVRDLSVSFTTRRGRVRAVERVSFQLEPGEVVGLVGESGSGKSVTCQSLLRLLPEPPARIDSGSAVLGGTLDLLRCPPEALRRVRGRRIGVVFQDPMTALNPFLRLSTQLLEPLTLHFGVDRREALVRAQDALEEVGIPDAGRRLQAYPHEFSGGMRQRALLAMALLAEPEILLADEPTTALDVTVQAQILDLLRRLQRQRGLAVLLVTHHWGVVAGLCDRVLVFYAGRVVESGPVGSVFARPAHPYTEALQRAIPTLETPPGPLPAIPGHPPDPRQELPGCPFAPRCPHAVARCTALPAVLQPTGQPGHDTACWRRREGEIPPTADRPDGPGRPPSP